MGSGRGHNKRVKRSTVTTSITILELADQGALEINENTSVQAIYLQHFDAILEIRNDNDYKIMINRITERSLANYYLGKDNDLDFQDYEYILTQLLIDSLKHVNILTSNLKIIRENINYHDLDPKISLSKNKNSAQPNDCDAKIIINSCPDNKDKRETSLTIKPWHVSEVGLLLTGEMGKFKKEKEREIIRAYTNDMLHLIESAMKGVVSSAYSGDIIIEH